MTSSRSAQPVDAQFLAKLFAPSRSANGSTLSLRRTSSTRVSKGRKARRVARFNAMSAANQEALRRTGKREAYLRGEVTLPEVRRELREQAVQQRIVKPLRIRTRVNPREKAKQLADLVDYNTNRPFDKRRYIEEMTIFLGEAPDDEEMAAIQRDVERITSFDEYLNMIPRARPDGHATNPLWYHNSQY